MNAALLIFLAVVAGAVLVLVVAGVRALLRRESVKDPFGLGSQLAGLIAGSVLAVGLWVVDRHLILVLAPVAGMCWLIGLIAAERTRKRQAVTAAGLMVAPTLAGLLVPMGASMHATCPSGVRDALALAMLAAGAGLALISAAAWVAALLTVGRAVVPRVAEA